MNRTYRRTGSLWEGRFRSCLVQEDNYLLACQRYIELNPVRAGMLVHPGEYRWSSYRVHAQGETSSLVTPHSLYLAIGADDETRQAAYRALFRPELEPGVVDAIRQATNGNSRWVIITLGRRSPKLWADGYSRARLADHANSRCRNRKGFLNRRKRDLSSVFSRPDATYSQGAYPFT